MLCEGGTSMPCTDEAMVTVVAKSRSYPALSIAGISTDPSEDMSAIGEPEIPPKNIEATILTIARPPRIQPTTARARRSRRSVIPPPLMMSPARMKNGTASSEKDARLPTIRWNAISSGMFNHSIVASEDSAMEKATFVPISNKTTKLPSRIETATGSIIRLPSFHRWRVPPVPQASGHRIQARRGIARRLRCRGLA